MGGKKREREAIEPQWLKGEESDEEICDADFLLEEAKADPDQRLLRFFCAAPGCWEGFLEVAMLKSKPWMFAAVRKGMQFESCPRCGKPLTGPVEPLAGAV